MRNYLSEKRLTHLVACSVGLVGMLIILNIVGNTNYATIEKGKKLVDYEVQALAKFIKSVKDDQVMMN